jgi:NAD(P)-dependent dehydrogenase (short-subunit alcohol dehydrogenase family)
MASVLITGTSKGIGFESTLAFGRAGHKVHATMRRPSQSPALAETAAREKLPITQLRLPEAGLDALCNHPWKALGSPWFVWNISLQIVSSAAVRQNC